MQSNNTTEIRMNSAECLAKAAAAAEKAALDAFHREAVYAATFGGSADVAVHARKEAADARRAAREWRGIAQWHPRTRDAAVRKGDLPVYLFGY